jgi:hypothetical protein
MLNVLDLHTSTMGSSPLGICRYTLRVYAPYLLKPASKGPTTEAFLIHAEFRPHPHILTQLSPAHILMSWPNSVQPTSLHPAPHNSRPHPHILTQLSPGHIFISWPNSVQVTSSHPDPTAQTTFSLLDHSSGNSLTSSLLGSTSIISALLHLSLSS